MNERIDYFFEALELYLHGSTNAVEALERTVQSYAYVFNLSDQEVVDGTKTAKQETPNIESFLSEENFKLREAGFRLAEAALFVGREHDGVHRLMLAVSEWSKVVAGEGGRERLHGERRKWDR